MTMPRADGPQAPLPEPRVILTVEATTTYFLVDTRAEFLVLKEPLGEIEEQENCSNSGYLSESILLDH